MESLRLYRGDELLSQVVLGERPLELGRAPSCDIVIEDPGVAERHWVALRKHGTLMAYDVSGARTGKALHLPLGERVPLGREHCVERVRAQHPPALRASDTEALSTAPPSATYHVVVGRGTDARRVRIARDPIHVGRAPDSDLTLVDAAVSLRHCRLEPTRGGVLVRDLGSRNGTYVQGARVERAVVHAGASLRVGRSELFVVETDAASRLVHGGLVAESPAMLAVVAEAQRAAALSWPALVHGPSGAGKEGIATLLHEHGPRRGRPFVTLNAGGVPAELVESELFGHERGAFTGAQQARRGVFEQADGGTLFLDEIGELPLSLQSRLLRVLDSGEIRRVGAEGTRRVDVRVVCATHRDLRAMVAAGQFRQDLYYRVARIVIEVPPLRARPQDVRAIAQTVLAEVGAELGGRELSKEAMAVLLRHDWPGNVRELRNVLCAVALRTGSAVIEAGEVERVLFASQPSHTPRAERDRELLATVARHGGNLTLAARAIGMKRTTLRDRVRVLRATARAPVPQPPDERSTP